MHQGQWTAGRGLGRSVQDYRPIGRSAHASIRNTDHVSHTFAEQFRRQQQVADLSHTGIPAGAAVLEDHHATLIDVQRLVVYPSMKFFDRFEGYGPPAMVQWVWTRG